MQWIPTGTGHELAVRDGVIVVRNNKGKELTSVPPAARKTSAWGDLDAALSFLHTHNAEVGAEMKRWLLCSLPIPRAILAEVWADKAWRSWLTDLVVASDDGEVAGFLRAIDPCGLGVVDLDGESATVTAEQILFPHPALLVDPDDLRELAVELGTRQRFDQLFHEMHRRPDNTAPEVVELTQYVGGEFGQLRFATGRASSAGFRVSGSCATCLCFEDGEPVMARYWTGARSPEYEAVTGSLHWMRNGRIVSVTEVSPLTYSEGVRMTAHIFAGRKVKADKDER